MRRSVLHSMVPIVGVALLLVSCARPASRTLVVHDAWARPAADSGVATAVYAQLENRSPEAMTVTGFASDAAIAAELHETVNSNGLMRMEPRPRVRIPPGGTLAMKPGSYHLMLVGIAHPLAVGDSIRITIRMATGDSIITTAYVREP